MVFLIWTLIGGIVGWLASLVMREEHEQGVLLNVIIGIVGSILGGVFIAPIVGVGDSLSNVTVAGVLAVVCSAIILLALFNLFRSGSVR